MDANQLRSTFTGFYAAAGPRRRPVGQPDPPRSHRAVHHRRDGAVQAVLHRRGAAAVAAGHVGAEVLPDRRHRHHRHHRAALHLLRDARQLQLRRLLQVRRHPPGLGAADRGPRDRPRPAVGDRARVRRRGRSRSGWTRRGCPTQRIQALGEDNFWQMGDGGPGRAVRRRSSSSTGARTTGDDGGPAHGGAERFVEIYNLVFMQYNRLSDGTLEDLPGKSIDTGAGLERNLPMLQGVRVAVRDRRLPARSWPWPRTSPRSATAPTRTPTCRCASWPTTPGPWPWWWPTA